MVSHLVFYQLGLIALVWVSLMLHRLWPSEPCCSSPDATQAADTPMQALHKVQALPGLTRKPSCAACEQTIEAPRLPPSPPPTTVPSTRGRRRHVDTSDHFVLIPTVAMVAGLGLGNITSNGHPSGGPWRQLYCGACRGYFLETHGTPFHGKHVSPDKLVWAVGALAEGLGIRAVARVFEVDPNTVLAWLIAVADHAVAFSQYFLHNVRVTQVQLDELFALLSAVKAGKISDTEAIQRLALAALGVDGDRPGEQVVAGDRRRGAHPRDGATRRASGGPGPGPWLYALIPDRWLQRVHDGLADALWPLGPVIAPPGHRASPKPRWIPLPGLLYAQVIKTVRRRAPGARDAPRGVRHAGGGPAGAGSVRLADQHGLRRAAQPDHPPACGGGGTAGQHALQGRGRPGQQLSLYHVYYNFCLPHASLRHPLLQPEPTHGSGSASAGSPRRQR